MEDESDLASVLNNSMKISVNLIKYLALASLVVPALALANPTLYERLGGMSVIREVVSDTIDRTAADPRTKPIFDGIKLAPVKESVAIHFCEITGGPCIYDGASMSKAHSGMQISSAQFDLMDDYLGKALTKQGISEADKAALARLLQPLKPDIIGK
jgi:hemoglobin